MGLAAILFSAIGFSATSAAAGQTLTVVELFTSQGCWSCPPANANLIKVKDQPGVLALSFNVTYWDYLGWKDTFGKEEFTQRQVRYEPSLGRSGPFTPQVVVNGRADVWLVHYRQGVVEVPVARGENTGRTLPHANVVHSLTRLGSWTGDATALPLPAAASGLSTAVLVQVPGGGPILGAAAN
ncbi:DUF1223 domain-containing protein [Mesorhizobium sp. M0027]|uniref:DUF1223 domain-containing protein n=1 Tax=unclassified Mesorhizobium TaxID=325217 RepID=UPI0012EC659A|nr:DUF1223 domain-containing protein [Mesorhizobium sp. LSHC420B00]